MMSVIKETSRPWPLVLPMLSITVGKEEAGAVFVEQQVVGMVPIVIHATADATVEETEVRGPGRREVLLQVRLELPI